MEADGFTHTIHLDCGCRLRLKLLTNPIDIGRGDFLYCIHGHSDRYYDQEADELIYEYDREVIAVVQEPFDGVANAM